MSTAELQQKIAALEKQYNSFLFEDEKECEKIYNKIQRLKFRLEMEKERSRQ